MKPITLASPGPVKQRRQTIHVFKVCPVCLKEFGSTRSHVTTCGLKCRELMSRCNKIMRRECADLETSDDFLQWLAGKVIGKVEWLEDGTPHVTWKITAQFRYWAYRYLTTLNDGTQFDDLMDELARPLILAYPNRRRTK